MNQFLDVANYGLTCEISNAKLFNPIKNRIDFNASLNRDVKYVSFRFSWLYYLPEEILEKFPAIEMLGISNSQITHLESREFFRHFSPIQKLRITNTKITNFTSDTLKFLQNLKWIHLINLNIEHLANDLFINNHKLEYIDLYYNNIKWIDQNVFRELKFLKEIDLRKNWCIDEDILIVDGTLSVLETKLSSCYGTCVTIKQLDIRLIVVACGYIIMFMGLLVVLALILKGCCAHCCGRKNWDMLFVESH